MNPKTIAAVNRLQKTDQEHKICAKLLGHEKLEHTDRYTQLIDLGDNAFNVAHATILEEENKLI